MTETAKTPLADVPENERHASRRDYLERWTNAQSIEELWQLHWDKTAEDAFDRLDHGYTR